MPLIAAPLAGAKATPFISCSYLAPPSPPHPPPYPPWPTAAPLRDCGLGASHILTKAFTKTYSIDIAMRGWQEGVTVYLDYSHGGPPGAMEAAVPTALDVTDCYGCEVVAGESTGGVLALRTKGASGLPSHSNGVGYKANLPPGFAAPSTAAIRCHAVMPPPPSPPPPPWCGLRPHYVLTGRKDDDKGRNGREAPLFEAEVSFEVWEAGAEVTLEWNR